MMIFTALYSLIQNGNSENREFVLGSKIVLLSKTVRDFQNRSADIGLLKQAVGQAGHYLPK